MHESSVELQEDEQDTENEGEEEANVTASNAPAAHMCEQCLAWLEHQPEANACNTSVLRQLHTLAACKRIQAAFTLKRFHVKRKLCLRFHEAF